MSETTDTNLGNGLGFPLKGTLRRTPFPKLVRQLARTKSTGSLYLLNGKTKKVVFFDRGEPISVRSNVTAECLGQILAREGLITQAQCDQTLESIRRTGKKQGELLIEMGILSEGNLRYGLEAQLRHKLFDIFAWDDGRYQYKPDVRGDDHGLRFTTDAQALILTALIEISDEAHALAALDPYADRFPVIDSNGAVRFDVAPEEHYLLDCLDGSRNIAELLETPPEPSVPSVALLLYASIQSGIAKLGKSRRQARPHPDAPKDGRDKPDRELEPGYTPKLTVTTYEDTPLPGELPKAPDVDLDDDFGVDEHEHDHEANAAQREVDSSLVAAERDTPDETFDEDLDSNDEPEDSGPSAPALVADPAESGVFQRVLDDDDDERPLDDDEPVVGAGAGAGAGTDDADDDETEAVMPALEVEAGVVDDELDVLDELVEIEELDELDELEEVQDEPDVLESARPTEIPTHSLESSPGPTADLVAADDLAALADDLEIDDDLALDGDALDGALELLDSELPLEQPLTSPVDEAASPDDGASLADAAGLDEAPVAPDIAAADIAAAAELVSLDDLDDVELELDDAEPLLDLDDVGDLGDLDEVDELDDAEELDLDPEATMEADSETLGALHFSDGEVAVNERRWAEAISHLEAAYQHGMHVAELHALLAWARFEASGESPEMADHALELLAYAEDMNPGLAIVYAYRSAVLLSIGDSAGAQDAAQSALDIDPYDELAIDVMDKLV